MSLFVTSLKVDARVVRNSAVVEIDTVVTVDCPPLTFSVTAGHKVSYVAQNVLVHVAFVARGDHEEIHVHGLLRRRLGLLVLVAVVADVQAETVIRQVGDALDGAVVEQTLGPFLFALVLEAVGVEFRVDVLNQLDADDAVVCGFVEGNGRLADLGVLVESVVDLFRVKDFVDAGEWKSAR